MQVGSLQRALYVPGRETRGPLPNESHKATILPTNQRLKTRFDAAVNKMCLPKSGEPVLSHLALGQQIERLNREIVSGLIRDSYGAKVFFFRIDRSVGVIEAILVAIGENAPLHSGRVSSQSLVRYRGTDYSVPTAYGHREVLVHGYVHAVTISCGADIIARHPRSYEREDFVFNPLHYLALLERKTGALDQAAPLAGWDLPEAFATLRRLLELRMGKQGKREFVQVLRLMEVFRIDDVAAGVRDAIDRGVIGFDAVKHLVLCRIERRPPRLDMSIYPYLPHASVALTSARTYMDLLSGVTS